MESARTQRIGSRLSQERIAEKASVHVNTVKALCARERGVDRTSVERVFRGLGIDLEESDTQPATKNADTRAQKHEIECVRASVPEAESSRLPVFLTPLYGREADGLILQKKLAAPSTRLVTLTGLGGIGKTRLAVAVAEQESDRFPDGVRFVSLTDNAAPASLLESIREALGLPGNREKTPLTQLVEALENQRLLLLLDNMEQLLPEGARIVENLLQRLPLLTVLATSRYPLNAAGEQEVSVPPLSAPAPSDITTINDVSRVASYPSVQLFVEKATARRADFELTSENAGVVAVLCHALDGVPLAIELAAAWSAILTPMQIDAYMKERFRILISRRNDLPERQRSMKAILEESYHSLSPAVQRFFSRLSVFCGGWTLEAAEAVCTSSEEATNPTAFEALDRLREASLVTSQIVPGGARYRFLETIREFASETLLPEERTEVERRHLRYFLTRAQQYQNKDLFLRNHALIEQDDENYQMALSRCFPEAQAPDPVTARALWVALRSYWEYRGHWGEAQRWSEEIARHADTFPPSERARIFFNVGEWAWAYHQHQGRAEAFLIRAIKESDACEEWQLAAQARTMLAVQCEGHGDVASALSHLQKVLENSDYYPSSKIVVSALDVLGNIKRVRGHYREAWSYYERGLNLYRSGAIALSESQLNYGIAYTLEQLGNTAWHLCQFAEARRLHEEAILLMEPIGKEKGGFGHKFGLAEVARCEEKWDEARQLYEECVWEARKRNRYPTIAKGLAGLGNVLRVQGDLEEARSALQESLAIRRDAGRKWGIMNSLEAIAHLSATVGQADVAAQLYGASHTIRDELACPVPPPERPDYERCIEKARALSHSNDFEVAFLKGRCTPLEISIELSLSL